MSLDSLIKAEQKITGLEAENDELKAANANLKTVIEELQRLVRLYQGIGDAEIPEEDEYHSLAEIPKERRTPEQTARLRELAVLIPKMLNEGELWYENAELKKELAVEKLNWERAIVERDAAVKAGIELRIESATVLELLKCAKRHFERKHPIVGDFLYDDYPEMKRVKDALALLAEVEPASNPGEEK